MKKLGDKPYFIRAIILFCLFAGAAGVIALFLPDSDKPFAIKCAPLLIVGLLVWKLSDAAEEKKEQQGKESASLGSAGAPPAATIGEKNDTGAAAPSGFVKPIAVVWPPVAARAREVLAKYDFRRPDPGPAHPGAFDGGASYREVFTKEVGGKEEVVRVELFTLGCITGESYDGSSDSVCIDLITGEPWYVVTRQNGGVADFFIYGGRPISYTMARDLEAALGTRLFADLSADNWREHLRPKYLATANRLAAAGAASAGAGQQPTSDPMQDQAEPAKVGPEQTTSKQAAPTQVEPERTGTSKVWVVQAGNQGIATLRCIRKYGNLDLDGARSVQREGAPCVVAEKDVEKFVQEMEALGNVVSREPASPDASPKPRLATAPKPAPTAKPAAASEPDSDVPRRSIDPSSLGLQWTTDADDLFASAKETGSLSGRLAEVWCDAREKDDSFVLERMDAWSKATTEPLRWFVVLDHLLKGSEPEVIASVREAYPHWEISWVMQEGFVRGAAFWNCADAPMGMWYAPLEDAHYLTRFAPDESASAGSQGLCLITARRKKGEHIGPYNDEQHVTHKHVWWPEGREMRRYALLSRNDEEEFLRFLANQGVKSQYMSVVEDHDMYEEHDSASSNDFMELVDNGTIARIYGTWYLRVSYRGANVEVRKDYPNLHHGIRVGFKLDDAETVAPLLKKIEHRYCYERIYLELG